LNEVKLAAATGAVNLRPATPDEIQPALGAKPGSLGAVNVSNMPVYADESLRGVTGMVTGANEDGFHFRNVSIDRDIKVEKWADLRTVAKGEPCPTCGAALNIRRAIEVGHVFKLGTKYSEKLDALFVAEDGTKKPAIMGCYGIGITRTMQAVIEQSNDKDGIIWPMSVAPFQVCITPLGITPGHPVMVLAEKLYNELTARDVEVILDDREERPGVKFKDSELIGIPIRIGIGEKSLAKGEVEIKVRGGALTPVKPDEAVAKVLELIAAASR
jgi:prolyl-tRNA synthetase